MKLYIVIVGLFAIVEPKLASNGPAVALLLRLDSETIGSSGIVVPPHQAIAFFRAKGYPKEKTAQWLFDGEDVEIGVLADSSPALRPEDFVEMQKIVGTARDAKVARGCIGASPATDCLIDEQPALAGRIKLWGGNIRPLNIPNLDPRTGEVFVRERQGDVVGFRSARSSDIKSDYVKAAPNGLLYSRSIDLASFRLILQGESVELDVAREEDCKKFGVDPRCAIVTVLNVPVEDSSSHPMVVAGRGRRAERVDPHFEVFYDIIEEKKGVRLLPFRRLRPTDPNEDPPEGRCIPPFLKQ